jgi:hypothetical protein
VREKKEEYDTSQRSGKRGDDDEWVDLALEVYDNQEINQHDREDKAAK